MSSFHIKDLLPYFGFYIENEVINGKSIIVRGTILATFLCIFLFNNSRVYCRLPILRFLNPYSRPSPLFQLCCASVRLFTLCLFACGSLCLGVCLHVCLCFLFAFLSLFYGEFVLVLIAFRIQMSTEKSGVTANLCRGTHNPLLGVPSAR